MKKTMMILGVVFAMALGAWAADHAGGTEISFGTIRDKYFSGMYSDSIYKVTGGASDVTFENCTFENVSANADGSCVYIDRNDSDSGDVIFKNCKFINCGNTSYDGGAIYIGGSGKVQVNFSNCAAVNCQADYGGFLYCENVNASISGNGSTICSGCRAEEDGGAVYLWNANSISGFTFVGCEAGDYGGAIYNQCNDDSAGAMSDCRFYGNRTTVSGGKGGAIWSKNEGKALANCVFYNNDVFEGTGADIYLDKTITVAGLRFYGKSHIEGASLIGEGEDSCLSLLGVLTLSPDDQGVYHIKDAFDWDRFYFDVVNGRNSFNGKTVKLETDIAAPYPVGAFTGSDGQKKPFQGIFEGQGHVVTVAVSGTGSDKGVFSCSNEGATIKDLRAYGAIQGAYSLGGIVGNASNTTIQNCESHVCIFGTAAYAGGIVGYSADNTKITACRNYGDIRAADQAGGVAGHVSKSNEIRNCVNHGFVEVTGSCAGGIAGLSDDGSKFLECLNYGKVTAAKNADGIIGSKNGTVTVRNCHSDDTGYIVGRISDDEYVSWEPGNLYLVKGGVSNRLDFTTMTKSIESIEGGRWYVVDGFFERDKIKVKDVANLVLLRAVSLTVKNYSNEGPGISVPQSKTLNIFGADTGSLTVTGGQSSAGIGGGYGDGGGTVTIYGGTVTATGGGGGAGIGGGYHSGSQDGMACTVTINGGIVKAMGGGYGSAGIGGGCAGNGGTVTINGGTVTAIGCDGGADIGCGLHGTGGSLILGAHVLKTGGHLWQEGILVTFDIPANIQLASAQADNNVQKIVDKGAGRREITLLTGHSLALKFAPNQFYELEGSEVVKIDDCEGDVVLEASDLPTAKYVGVTVSFAMPKNLKLTSAKVDNGNLVQEAKDGVYYYTFVSGNSLTLSFEPTNFKDMIDGDKEVAFGPIVEDTTIDASKLPTVKLNEQVEVDYVLANGTSNLANAYPLFSKNHSVMISNGWYVVNGEVTTAEITVKGNDVNLILADGAKLTVNGGIGVDKDNTLTIYAQQGGSGELIANGAFRCAGIGGRNPNWLAGYGNCGNIIINGGIVKATGGGNGAGIGGGIEGEGGTITLNGGAVTANGGYYGAGIGGGWWGKGGNVTINGGTVEAKGDNGGKGIGGGYSGKGGGSMTLGENIEIVEGTIDGDYIKIAEKSGPTCEGGTIAKVGGVWVVTPGEGVTEIKVSNLSADATLVVPPTVTRVEGANDEQIRVYDGGKDITELFAIKDGAVQRVAWTVTVGELSHMTAAWTSDGGETNAIENGSFSVPVEATGVKVIFTPEEGIVLVGESVVELGAVTDDITFGPESGYLVPTAVVPYLDWDAERQQMTNAFCAAADCTFVTSETTTLEDGKWYAVMGAVEIANGTNITVSGNAHLILCDGASLTIKDVAERLAAIDVPVSGSVTNSLSIYGSQNGSGALTATGGKCGAGIGCGDHGAGGSVTINGGEVTAQGGMWGAGIGGSYYGSCGAVTVNGGSVTAQGGMWGAGIGGGVWGDGGTITINGGSVTAKCDDSGAGIGGGYRGKGGTVTISGGIVTATGGEWGAGIGSGYYGSCGAVTITDGAVTANGGKDAADIGSGRSSSCDAVMVSGGLFWEGLKDDWIAEGYEKVANADPATKDAYPWAVRPLATVTVGEFNHMTAVWTSGDGTETNAVVGGVFGVSYGRTGVKVIFTPEEGFVCAGESVVDLGTITTDITFGPESGYLVPTVVVPYLDWDAERQQMTNAFCAAADCTFVTSGTTAFEDGKWYAVTGAVEIANGKNLTVKGAAHLILGDDASLTVKDVADLKAAIDVSASGSVTNKLTIYAQHKGTGSLTAQGGNYAAGIGGGNDGNGGTVTINGGTVMATGGYFGAGIGGGGNAYGGKGNGGTVTINGGQVTAQGGQKAAGIGGGYRGNGGTVTVNGGVVTATGQDGGKDIGGGEERGGGSVTITGGTLVAEGSNGLDNGLFDGGNIKASSIGGQPSNTLGKAVYCVTVPLPSGTDATKPVEVVGLENYGCNDLYALDDDKLYLYLSNGSYDFTVDGVWYFANVNGAATTAELYPTCEGGTVEKVDGVWIVVPTGGVTEVTVAGLPDGATVAVPPTVTQVKGVDDAQIKVKSGTVDITGAFTVTGGAIRLDPKGSVTIGDETIPVTPTIGDLDAGEEPFTVGGTVAVTVKAIPGLKYTLRRAESLSAPVVESGDGTGWVAVAGKVATGATVTLEDAKPPEAAAFYRIEVSVP